MAVFFLMQMEPSFKNMYSHRPADEDPTFLWLNEESEKKIEIVQHTRRDGGYIPVAHIEAPDGYSLEEIVPSLYVSVQPASLPVDRIAVTGLGERVSAGIGDIFMDEDGNFAVFGGQGFVLSSCDGKELEIEEEEPISMAI